MRIYDENKRIFHIYGIDIWPCNVLEAHIYCGDNPSTILPQVSHRKSEFTSGSTGDFSIRPKDPGIAAVFLQTSFPVFVASVSLQTTLSRIFVILTSHVIYRAFSVVLRSFRD